MGCTLTKPDNNKKTQVNAKLIDVIISKCNIKYESIKKSKHNILTIIKYSDTDEQSMINITSLIDKLYIHIYFCITSHRDNNKLYHKIRRLDNNFLIQIAKLKLDLLLNMCESLKHHDINELLSNIQTYRESAKRLHKHNDLKMFDRIIFLDKIYEYANSYNISLKNTI